MRLEPATKSRKINRKKAGPGREREYWEEVVENGRTNLYMWDPQFETAPNRALVWKMVFPTAKASLEYLRKVRAQEKVNYHNSWRGFLCERNAEGKIDHNLIAAVDRTGPNRFWNINGSFLSRVWGKAFKFGDIFEKNTGATIAPGWHLIPDRRIQYRCGKTSGMMDIYGRDSTLRKAHAAGWIYWDEYLRHHSEMEKFLLGLRHPIYMFSDREDMFEDPEDSLIYNMTFC